jgi:uncharacterized protein (DUF2126 family)
VHWRTDGVPVWNDRELLAEPAASGGSSRADAKALAAALVSGLGLPRDAALAAYEDPMATAWNEARLPGDDPAPELGADPGDPVGWVVPLRAGEATWETGTWHLRRGRLFLIPGDSPVGMRLPLDALTWRPGEPDPEPLITALCVQERDGHVCVFLPPLEETDDALALVGVVERCASALRLPVVVEGYGPPGDDRTGRFDVTPDPGVIEVNIHPSASWAELDERTTTLFDAAERVGLSAEKFALDGLHTGTGGGNHITLGGRTAADSPFLRRPDLLRSLITFWQHHPALSYLFSGRFVGPTSQAPRVDEGRDDSLYELEIAFAELDRLEAEGTPRLPWQVDRLLRNLLVDLTGNTHRAEFCIDKLFSPDHERGRLGVVELRAFEMPPHPRMALVQALLVRALVARCWRDPYRGPLVRWGTELHDRFMLPWWIAADVADIARDLREHGFAFDAAWLDPFLEFRFPRLGVSHVDGVTIELRQAIEPWHVLGEESGSATARYVDSSVERLQIRVDGLTSSRHAVTCNNRLVPLQPTATPGTFVAGIRFRAWQPPSALHPTIGVHSPLVFDVVDRWSSRALGGCTYHVVHPGGRAYETLPVNAGEAEARRASRFEAHGHTPGQVEIPQQQGPGEHPRTLDLRRA